MLSKGTVVTCEDCNKPMASVARRIKSDEAMSRGDLEKFRVKEPSDKDDIKRVECPHCGGKWMRSDGKGGIHVHTDAYGWQPGKDEGLR